MKFVFSYEHHHGAGAEWDKRKMKRWLVEVFEAPSVKVAPRCTREIREHVESQLLSQGWALNVDVNQRHRLKIFAGKEDLAIQLQTGNISRVPYDLLKMQYLFQSDRVSAAALALPTREAAKVMGENIANAERIIDELKLFAGFITVPIMVIAFE